MINLDTIVVHKGKHPPPTGSDVEACTMELVSLLANEPWSDHPNCACPYITRFVINWQDNISDEARRTELMRPLIPRIVGTRRDDALMLRRLWMGVDWDIRTRTPSFLRAAGLDDSAAELESLPEITSPRDLWRAHEVAQRAAQKAAAAWAAAWAAAGDAAWDAVRAFVRDAVRAAAGDAAGGAAWAAAAGGAAWAAAWDDAAWDAVRAAAGDAAADAAGAAAWDATRAAAWDASRATLAPLVADVQLSAQALVMRMCALDEKPEGST